MEKTVEYFELYDKRYNDNENPEVDIYVAVK